MLKKVLIAAGALAAIVVMPALPTPAAIAEAPKGKNKANKHVARTGKLRSTTQPKEWAWTKLGDIKGQSPNKGNPKGREDCMSCAD